MSLLSEGGASDGGSNNSGGAGSGAPGGGNSSSGASGGSQGGGGASPSWRDSLPQELKENVSLSKFSDLGSLAKSYLEVQSYVGKKGVFPPGEKSTPEQWKEFAKQIGQPEFEKFDIKAPEGKKLNPQIIEGFKKLSHESGLMPHQAQGLMDWFINQEQASSDAQRSAQENEQKTKLEELKKEWAGGYDKQVALARMAVKEIGGDEFAEHLKKSNLGNDVTLIKYMAKVGAILGEDKIRGEGGGSMGQTPAEIRAEISRVMGDPKNPYFDKAHPAHAQAMREMEERYKKLG